MFNQKFRRDYRLQKYKFFLYYGYFSKILNQSYNSTGYFGVLQLKKIIRNVFFR